jgi:hypothetical protein
LLEEQELLEKKKVINSGGIVYIKTRGQTIICFHKKIQQDAIVYQNFLISYLYEAHHVSGDTPPIVWSLKLH